MALGSAVLFGLSTPLSKMLLGQFDPIMLASLFYLGSGIGLSICMTANRLSVGPMPTPIRRPDIPWLASAVFCGGVLAPLLLMSGLQHTNAATASLLLNLESVFTACIAWIIFKEATDRRIVLGMLAIVIGSFALISPSFEQLSMSLPALLIAGACLGWATDNNLTRKISKADALQIAAIKGLVAGSVNFLVAISIGARLPDLGASVAALTIGFFSYGLSLVLFILALRHIGTARSSAYFSAAPFIGAATAILVFKEPITIHLIIGAMFMLVGMWLHLTENHEHEHTHEALEHEHEHVHDDHHQHDHTDADPAGEPHSHVHQHARLTHKHPHFPDLHHDHNHT
jgi:drug/metabolite transporter (DMT)-like permease